MMKRIATVFTSVFLLFALTALPAQAQQADSIYTVDSAADNDDATPGDGACDDGSGNCTLRAAISEANAAAGGTILIRLPGVLSTTTTPPQTYTITSSTNEDANADGDFDIGGDFSELTIRGTASPAPVVDADSLDRAFDVQSGNTVTIERMDITNGEVDAGGAITDPVTNGGGIRNNGDLTLDQVAVYDNAAGDGGGTDDAGGNGGDGGGIFVADGATLTITRSTVSGNFAGAGEDAAATTNADGGNGGNGGGIFAAGTLTIEESTVAENDAGEAGDGDGTGDVGGGGQGGGIAVDLNMTPSATLRNTIVAANVADTANNKAGPELFDGPGDNTFFSTEGFNLIRNNATVANVFPAGTPNGNNDRVGDPMVELEAELAALDTDRSDDLASTSTKALQTGSPAIDNGTNTNIAGNTIMLDQRGFMRPAQDGGTVDIGSYEFGATRTAMEALAVNEIDAITDSTSATADANEFVEVVNVSDEAVNLDNYALVLFNGRATTFDGDSLGQVYDQVELTGTLASGDAVVETFGAGNGVVDSAGAVGVYLTADASSDFPDGTEAGANSDTRVDAVFYNNATGEANELATALNAEEEVANESNFTNFSLDTEENSAQRIPEGVTGAGNFLASTPSSGTADNPDARLAFVQFDDQGSATADSVTVDSVFVPRDGYVAIHDATLLGPDGQPFTDDDQPLSSVIGVSENLSAGEYSDVGVELFEVPGDGYPGDSTLQQDQTLIAMPHEETGGTASPASNTEYNFLQTSGAQDFPYFSDLEGTAADSAVVDVAEVSVPEPGELVVTEFMPNSDDLADSDGEYIELYNTSQDSIALDSLTISDDDSDSHTIDSDSVIAPQGFAILARTADPLGDTTNIADYVYGTDVTLANDTDEIVISVGTGQELFRLEYGAANADSSGYAAVLRSTSSASGGTTDSTEYRTAVLNIGNDQDDGDTIGDNVGDFGSPGALGTTDGQVVQGGELIITEFMSNPGAVGDDQGEYIEVYNDTQEDINLNGFTLRDTSGADNTTINEDVIVPAKDFAILASSDDFLGNGSMTADYDFSGGFGLQNGQEDEIVLEDPVLGVIAQATYTDGDPSGAGNALELDSLGSGRDGVTQEGDYISATNDIGNDDGPPPTDADGAGDFGSPGEFGQTVPVELATFAAVQDGENVALTWKTLSEQGSRGFYVERSTDGVTFEEVKFIASKGGGTSTEAQSYRFLDDDLPFEGRTLTYRLKQVDRDGAFEYVGTVEVQKPLTFRLLGNFPNPFQRQTTIRYELPEATEVSIIVYDALGRKVDQLVSGKKDAGPHSVKLEAGRLSSGVYIYRIKAGERIESRQMVLVK